MDTALIIQLAIAVAAGGALTKLIELAFTAPARRIARKQAEVALKESQRDSESQRRYTQEDRLLQEIERLRGEVKELRDAVNHLRTDLMAKVGEVSALTARWYALRTAAMVLVGYVRHAGIRPDDTELNRILAEIGRLSEEHALWDQRQEDYAERTRAARVEIEEDAAAEGTPDS